MLMRCKVLLDNDQYSKRHDKVLEIIHKAVSLSEAKARKDITNRKHSQSLSKKVLMKTHTQKLSLFMSSTGLDACGGHVQEIV